MCLHHTKLYPKKELSVDTQKPKGETVQITEFNSPEFQVRSLTIDNEPWFVANDICRALGYANPRDAISKHVDADDKRVSQFATPSGQQNMTIINESGLYSLILRSNKPQAKKFKKWVTSEVLPSIRKSGSYQLPNTEPTSDKLELSKEQVAQMLNSLTKGFEVLAIEVGNLNKKLEQKTKPKPQESIQAKAIYAYKKSLKETEIAKNIEAIISNNPGINQTNLFKKLNKKRDDKTMRNILFKYTGIRWNYKQNGRENLYYIGSGECI